ncbi:MAG: hypothetical protein ABF296_13320 [Oceanococcaceae bacterium]
MSDAPAPSPALRRASRRRRRPPLEMELTVVVAFGPEEEDRVTVIRDRKLWMVGSIFQYRDRIARMAMATVMRAALLQPKVAAKIMPGLLGVASRASRRSSS